MCKQKHSKGIWNIASDAGYRSLKTLKRRKSVHNHESDGEFKTTQKTSSSLLTEIKQL